MSAVKPPEWDAMSANEQLQRYLKRLCAKAEEMSSLLGVASAGGLPVVTPLVNPATSTTTHASSAPDVSGSNTKAQESLEVIHDPPTVCSAMAQVTCSTDCLSQVVPTAIVNVVCDAATTTVCSEPAVDLDNKEAEPLTPAPATSSIGSDTYSITKEVGPPMEITNDSDPKVDVQEFGALSVNTTPATSVVDHSVNLLVSSDPAALTLTRCSTKCSSRDTNKLRYALHPATTSPWLVLRPKPWPSFWRDHAEETKVRPLPWPSFSMGRFLEHPYTIVQLHGIGLNSSSIPKKHFHIGDTWELQYILIGHYIKIFSGLFLCLWSLKQDNEDSKFSKHVKLFHGSDWLAGLCACPSTIARVLHRSCLATLVVHLFWHVKKLGVLSTELSSSIGIQLRQFELLSSSMQSSHEFHAQAQQVFSAPVLQHSWLATMAVLLRKMGAGNTGHSSSIGLHLSQFEQLLSFATTSITDQWQLIYDKHAAVCNIPRHEKSQGAMQIRSMLLIRSFLSRRGFQGNVYLSKSALQDLIAAQSVVLLTRSLPNMFCCIIILGSGDISWYLHQMILSTLKHSVKCTQAKLSNTYTYSVFNLQLSTFWAETACRSSMLFIFIEPLLHIHSVLLLLPWPPPHRAHGLQSADFFTREFSCPFGTLVLPCFPSEQISCEADHSCWYLALLKSLVAQTIQNAAEACDSKSSMFASVVLLFGHKKSMSKDLNFLHLKGSSSGLLFMASNIASIVCVIHGNKSCKEFSPDNHNQDGLACEPWFKSELADIVSIYGLRWCVASLIASLDEGLLGSISQPELGLVQFEAQKLEYILGITTVGLQSLAAIYVQIQLGACTKDGRKRALLQEEKNVSLLVSNGFYVAYFHKTKKLISLLRAFCESSYELQLVPCLCVGISHELVLMCYCRATQQSAQCDDGDGMATRTRCVVLIQGIDTPWDPGGITHELEKGRHWLEGKPVFKEGGMSAALYPGWATGHLSWANRHGLSPTERSRARPLHILEGEERAKVSSGSRTQRRRLLLLPPALSLSPVLLVPIACTSNQNLYPL